MKHERQSIGKVKAIALFNSGWWKSRTPREIAEFQILTAELCCPFDVFHEAIEKAIGRPVFTHEFAFPGLIEELFGERAAPNFEEILNLIPEGQRIVIQI